MNINSILILENTFLLLTQATVLVLKDVMYLTGMANIRDVLAYPGACTKIGTLI